MILIRRSTLYIQCTLKPIFLLNLHLNLTPKSILHKRTRWMCVYLEPYNLRCPTTTWTTLSLCSHMTQTLNQWLAWRIFCFYTHNWEHRNYSNILPKVYQNEYLEERELNRYLLASTEFSLGYALISHLVGSVRVCHLSMPMHSISITTGTWKGLRAPPKLWKLSKLIHSQLLLQQWSLVLEEREQLFKRYLP